MDDDLPDAVTYHQGEVFRIADLLSTWEPPYVLSNHVFDNCVLHGPGVIALGSEPFSWRENAIIIPHEHTDGGDVMLYDRCFEVWPLGGPLPTGAILLSHCTMLRCKFIGVNILASLQMISLLMNEHRG